MAGTAMPRRDIPKCRRAKSEICSPGERRSVGIAVLPHGSALSGWSAADSKQEEELVRIEQCPGQRGKTVHFHEDFRIGVFLN